MASDFGLVWCRVALSKLSKYGDYGDTLWSFCEPQHASFHSRQTALLWSVKEMTLKYCVCLVMRLPGWRHIWRQDESAPTTPTFRNCRGHRCTGVDGICSPWPFLSHNPTGNQFELSRYMKIRGVRENGNSHSHGIPMGMEVVFGY